MPPRKSAPATEKTYTDFVQPFLIDRSAIRGRLVRLEKSVNKILRAHKYPHAVSEHLAEQLVLAALLSATLAGEGILTVQAKGSGPVRFIVVDVMAGGVMRGYAEVEKHFTGEGNLPLSKVMGKGYLAVTFDPGGNAERHQSIVELTGNSLRETFEGYFAQSQQAEIALHVVVRAPDKKHKSWRAGGIIVERMPLEGGKVSKKQRAGQEDLWKRTKLFMGTLKEHEMLDHDVTPQNLLYRLFNEDGVWVTKLQTLAAGCRCSRKRVSAVLASLPQEEVTAMLDDKGSLSVHCQFCNTREKFTRAQVNRLYGKQTKRKKSN